MEHESDDDTTCNWCAWNNHERIGEGTGGLKNQMTTGDHPVYNIIKIGHNTEKSPAGFTFDIIRNLFFSQLLASSASIRLSIVLG